MNRLTTHWHQGAAAFTLSELLIAVAILGLIAALAIPKVLISVETQRKNAIFKETFADLHTVLVDGVQSGRDGELLFTYMATRMNATKVCDTSGSSQGCVPASGHIEFGQPTYLLPNGAAVGGFNVGWALGTGNGLAIDWNGNAGPNTEGDDILRLSWSGGSTMRLYAFSDLSLTGGSANSILYKSVFPAN